MDYLDPSKIKSYKQRLIIGYILLAIIVGIGTFLLMMVASGYVVDTKSGDVVRNGAIIANSNPKDALIKLDDKILDQKTNTRINTFAGNHNIEFSLNGHTSFRRNFDVEPSNVKNLSYSRLILDSSKPDDLEASPEPLAVSASSQDNETLQWCSKTTKSVYFKLKFETSQDKITIPENEFPNPQEYICTKIYPINATLSIFTYSLGTDKINFLIDYDKKTSTNLNKILTSSTPKDIIIADDKKGDQFSIYNPTTQLLSSYKISTPSIAIRSIQSVKDFAISNQGNIALITESIDKKLQLEFYKKDKLYKIRNLETEDYQLKIFEKGNDTFVLAASAKEQKTLVFRAPDKQINEDTTRDPIPYKVLKSVDLVDFGYSIGYKIIYIRTNNHLLNYNFEEDKLFKIEMSAQDLSSPLIWLDGYYFSYVNKGGSVQISDFDGSNIFNSSIKYDKYNLYKIDTYEQSEYLVVVGQTGQSQVRVSKLKLRDI